ncbi:hypothetical protein ETI05_10570 [Macrococcoides canis]|uniref:hypothetical protein n=1 Tax=Macrococcoides canis TaxID=1855823 RepID=UPI00105CBC9F|nr:hypothetical protein [Macrococcus canis]TDM19618.1 hypothetical protein ETI05_10570 [Macrococcus canis]TDM35536.1 hypothetical protein ETI11_10735 [Macrococcus canis]
MIKRTIRIEDPLIITKLKSLSSEKEISENKLINIILEKALIHDNFKLREQEVDEILKNVVASNNKLIDVIEEQTKKINSYTEEIKKIL